MATLFHRHAHDTAYVCLSAAADDEADAEVWNEELQEVLSEGSKHGSLQRMASKRANDANHILNPQMKQKFC